MITVEEGSIGGFAAHVMQVWLLQVAPCTLVRMLAAHAPTQHFAHLLTIHDLLQFLCLEGLMDGNLKFRPLTLPDRYIEHGTQVGRPRPSGEAVLRGRRGMGSWC